MSPVLPGRPEIVVGLVGAVGTDLPLIAELVAERLTAYGYDAQDVVSLSALLDDVERAEPLATAPREEYVAARMDAGDALRAATGAGDVLAQLAVAEIVRRRRVLQGEEQDRPGDAVAWILRSLKTRDELRTLRGIYGPRFVCISAHASKESRLKALAIDIAESHGSTESDQFVAQAAQLAARDEVEETTHGQDVRGTFPLADFFVDASHRDLGRRQLDRFLDAWFGAPFVTPTKDEAAMFQASAAAVRSADLSRQVGAALVDDGDVLAVGCNEVPAFGGGAYWHGADPDGRDFVRGGDANARHKAIVIQEVRNALGAAGWIHPDRMTDSPALFAEALEDTRVDALTEFGRAVHAEMAAILDAARRGRNVVGTTLYSTTFPCHNCAKHIVGAGIRRVVYIEPYPKSLAADLHPDTIAIDPEGDPDDRVVFRPFVGIAPLLYLQIFQWSRKRKQGDGTPVRFRPTDAAPKLVEAWDVSYLEREQLLLADLEETLDEGGQRLREDRPLPALNEEG